MLRCCSCLVVAIALAACADTGDEGFVILGNNASENCEFSGSEGQPFYSGGNLSVFSPSGYVFAPLLKSRIAATSDDLQRTIFLHGARVDLNVERAQVIDAAGMTRDVSSMLMLDADHNPDLVHFKVLVTGILSPGGTTNSIFEVVPADVLPLVRTNVPLAAGDRLHVTITATVSMFGDLGGSEVESSPFSYPIDICNDCNATVTGPCDMNMPPAVNVLGNACNPFQDGTIDCCLGDQNQLVCPI